MAFLNFSPFSLLFLAIFAFLLSHNAEGTNPLCKTTHYINLCESIINGATNARNATVNAIHAAMNTSEDIQKMIPSIEKAAAKLPPADRDALVKSCTIDFQDTVSLFNTSVMFVDRGDIKSAESFLSGGLFATNLCRVAVNEKVGAIMVLNKIIDLLNIIMDVTFTLAHQIKS